jgi:ribosomal protein S18 acetylase RimI-like enzyme
VDFCFSSSFLPYPSASTDNKNGEPQLIIRIVEAKDLKGLAEVLVDSFHPRQGLWYFFYPLFKLGIYEDLRSRLRTSSPHNKCLVASRVVESVTAGRFEEVVGTVEISLRAGTTTNKRYPYISNLAVSHHYRRQGVARKLLYRCEQIAQEWGCRSILLHVLEDNYSARLLYFSCGYRFDRVECTLSSWLFKKPRRLLLRKSMSKQESGEE